MGLEEGPRGEARVEGFECSIQFVSPSHMLNSRISEPSYDVNSL